MRAFVVVVFSFACPGFGAAFARQNRAMLAWLAATIVAALASLIGIWLSDAQSGLSLRRFGGVD